TRTGNRATRTIEVATAVTADRAETVAMTATAPGAATATAVTCHRVSIRVTARMAAGGTAAPATAATAMAPRFVGPATSTVISRFVPRAGVSTSAPSVAARRAMSAAR